MNGPLAAACSVVAGASAALAVVLFDSGEHGEAILFVLVALAAGGALVALLDPPRLLVCALVSAYAFMSAFLLPLEPGATQGHADQGHAHALAR